VEARGSIAKRVEQGEKLHNKNGNGDSRGRGNIRMGVWGRGVDDGGLGQERGFVGGGTASLRCCRRRESLSLTLFFPPHLVLSLQKPLLPSPLRLSLSISLYLEPALPFSTGEIPCCILRVWRCRSELARERKRRAAWTCVHPHLVRAMFYSFLRRYNEGGPAVNGDLSEIRDRLV
jgi:hypothetical protein